MSLPPDRDEEGTDLEITTETLENRQLRLTIEVDAERSERATRQAARQISKQVNIPGFRKGKIDFEERVIEAVVDITECKSPRF